MANKQKQSASTDARLFRRRVLQAKHFDRPFLRAEKERPRAARDEGRAQDVDQRRRGPRWRAERTAASSGAPE